MGLYADASWKNPSLNICEVKTNKNRVALYCVGPRLKQDIQSIYD